LSGVLAWSLVGLGVAVLVVRRRSIAVGLVTAQALLLAGYALRDASVLAALALGARAIGLAAVFLIVVARTREPRPVRADVTPLVRAGAAVAFALVLTGLIPEIGLSSRNAERAVLALVAFGIVTAATRRATIFQVIGIVLIENGIAIAALTLPGTSSLIELGIALDLTLVVFVAAFFHERIFAEFGAGDTAALRSLRD
jgi:hydrogenase-4 membrane subunit HyfE